jgi:hypothetical protein
MLIETRMADYVTKVGAAGRLRMVIKHLGSGSKAESAKAEDVHATGRADDWEQRCELAAAYRVAVSGSDFNHF